MLRLKLKSLSSLTDEVIEDESYPDEPQEDVQEEAQEESQENTES